MIDIHLDNRQLRQAEWKKRRRDLEKIVVMSLKEAMRRTGTTLRKEAIAEVMKREALTSGEIKKGWTKLVNKLRGTTMRAIRTFDVRLKIRDKPVSYIRLMPRSSRKPKSQRGISPGKRRKYKIKIERGRTVTLRRAFVMKARGKRIKNVGRGGGGFGDNYIVAQRVPPPKGKAKGSGRARTWPYVKSQKKKSIHHHFKEQNFQDEIIARVGPVFRKRFMKRLERLNVQLKRRVVTRYSRTRRARR